MARNKVQFQKGLSLSEFNKLYGREDQYHEALVKMRWPDGFVCPKCKGRVHAYCEPRKPFQCRACRVQTSVRAGTIFHKSRTPLTKWFLAMHLITSAKNDISGLELARQLDVKWDTAWLTKQKLLEAMLQRNSIYKLERDIQIDDACQGGEKPAIPGHSGRGARGKLPFVIAVLYQRAPRMFDALALARGDGRHARLLKVIGRVDLLILDDWRLAALTSDQGRDLLEIVDDRHGRGSTIVISQLPVEHWHDAIANPTIADAILDRLVHNAHWLTLKGDSLRKTSAKRSGLDDKTAA